MTLRTGLAVNSVSIDAPDVRLGQAGLVFRDISGTPRSGLFPNHTNAIVTSRTDMRVDVAAFTAAYSRGASYGAILFSNDGSIQSPLLAAPSANSWTYTLYVSVPDTTQADAAALPSLQVVRGAAAAIPQKLPVPTGGLELATITIPSTATTTQSANVVITQTSQYTQTANEKLTVRLASELTTGLGATLRRDQRAWALDTNREYTWTGSTWDFYVPVVMRIPQGTALPQNNTATTAPPEGTVLLRRIQYVSTGTDGSGKASARISYFEPFPNAVLHISMTTIGGKGNAPVINAGDIDRTGFTPIWVGSGSGTATFTYEAIGW